MDIDNWESGFDDWELKRSRTTTATLNNEEPESHLSNTQFETIVSAVRGQSFQKQQI